MERLNHLSDSRPLYSVITWIPVLSKVSFLGLHPLYYAVLLVHVLYVLLIYMFLFFLQCLLGFLIFYIVPSSGFMSFISHHISGSYPSYRVIFRVPVLHKVVTLLR